MTYKYIIDFDERGAFAAHIENEAGESVFEIADYIHLSELVNDGFIKYPEDTEGLELYLKAIGIIKMTDELIKEE